MVATSVNRLRGPDRGPAHRLRAVHRDEGGKRAPSAWPSSKGWHHRITTLSDRGSGTEVFLHLLLCDRSPTTSYLKSEKMCLDAERMDGGDYGWEAQSACQEARST